MGVRLQRHLGDVDDLIAGRWTTTPDGTATIACPLCGTRSELTALHHVAPGGEVTPAFACSNAACPFLEYVTLEAVEASP